MGSGAFYPAGQWLCLCHPKGLAGAPPHPSRKRPKGRRAKGNAPRGQGLKACCALGAFLRGRVSDARFALPVGLAGELAVCGLAR